VRGRGLMRAMFAAYTLLIIVGLVVYIVIGLTGS
jgi:hypothetical protein